MTTLSDKPLNSFNPQLVKTVQSACMAAKHMKYGRRHMVRVLMISKPLQQKAVLQKENATWRALPDALFASRSV